MPSYVTWQGVGLFAFPSYGFLRFKGAFPRSSQLYKDRIFNLQLLCFLHDYSFRTLCVV
jgi:hypothetical protein